MGQIYINGLRIHAHHGVLPQEQRVGNEFEVNVRLDVPGTDVAMDSDNLVDTVNYAEVVEIVKTEMSRKSKLIEHVAGRIRRAICDKYGSRISGGMVSVAKLAPPISAQIESVAFSTSW